MKREEFVSKINEAGLGGKVFVNPNNYAGGPYFLGCFFDGNQWVACQNTTHPRVCGLQYPPKVDISNQHNPQGWAYRWHCGSSTFRPDAISAPTTVPGNPSGSPRLRDT